MARDYAKKHKKRNSASRFDKQKTKPAITGKALLFTGLAGGLLIGILASYVLNLKLPTTTVPVSEEKKPAASAKSRYQAVPAEEASDTDFSFHNVLKNKVVEVPEQATEIRDPAAKARRYIMQCGSFRKQTLAESLKVQIAMNGFTARIKDTNEINGDVWYRVILGPYTSKRKAERERHQLERNDINNCRIW